MPNLHPLEKALTSEIINALCTSLSDEDLQRLNRSVTRTKFARPRRLYTSKMLKAQTPVEKITAKIDIRLRLKNNSIERQVFDATDRIAFEADLLDDEGMTLEDILIEIKTLTGITDMADPITIACCQTMFSFMNTQNDDMGSRLSQLARD